MCLQLMTKGFGDNLKNFTSTGMTAGFSELRHESHKYKEAKMLKLLDLKKVFTD